MHDPKIGMRNDISFALLKLTSQGKNVSVEDFVEQANQPQLAQANLRHLLKTRLISSTNGFLSMDASQRLGLAELLIQDGHDPTKVSRFLEWQEFEDFTNQALIRNGFRTVKHFVFKGYCGRREIDVLSWNDTFILAIDCKHWLRGLGGNRRESVAQAQAERVRALAKRSELLARAGVGDPSGRSIIPIILTLCNNSNGFVNGIPVVPISRLVSFLYGLSPIDDSILRIRIEVPGLQSRLL
ncbi:MAG TPA: hypothetical protein VLV18_06050 [Terriglobales bacterium]|nr:hypothetical protein [Terriglobales bacterium]